MSRWLSSVGNLLEKLDSRAETVVEERLTAAQDDHEAPMDDDNLHDILARRGLSAEELKDENAAGFNESSVGAWGEDEDMMDDVMDPSESTAHAQDEESQGEPLELAEEVGLSKEADDDVPAQTVSKEQEPNPAPVSENNLQKDEEEVKPQPPPPDESKGGDTTQDQAKEVSEKATNTPPSSSGSSSGGPPPTSGFSTQPPPPPPPKPTSKPTSPTPPRYGTTAAYKSSTTNVVSKKELVEAQKEARTLRRHVVSLNTELEAAESELSAQRVELERAAERMEKDRLRTKEEKEKLVKQHAEEFKTLKAQQEQALKEKQARMEEQMKTYRNQMIEMEDLRKQEGGDWNKELEQAIDRVQEMNQQVDQLEEEKSTLLSQITTLQGQQEMLGSRLESLTQTADSAMEREREADERLDAALTVHAKQISQRQSRDTELERTVQELGAALVVARNKEQKNRINKGDRTNGDESEPDHLNSFRARVEALESDLESANAHLALERERSQTMQKELREMSKETTQEASSVYAKQLHYDRQIADLNVTISKLQSSLREAERNPSSESMGNSDDGDMANQVKKLSEEVLRLREKVASFNSGSLAMKNRLRSAMDRAAKAEDHLTEARTSAASNDDFDSMERGPTGNGMSRRRRGGGNQSIGSIRSTFRLEPGQGEGREHLGKVVDVVDGFAVTTGKYLRRYPLARAGFIFYLLIIHAWTFLLLFMHAHSFETIHGDFGAGIGVPHSPHALMQQPQQDILQQVQQAKAEVEVPP